MVPKAIRYSLELAQKQKATKTCSFDGFCLFISLQILFTEHLNVTVGH
jgi:hypothetical protein